MDKASLQTSGAAPWTDRYFADGARAAEPSLISIQSIRGFIWRQRLILAGVVALGLLGGFLLTLLTTPLYEATATVRVDPQEPDIFQGQALDDTYISDIAAHIATLARVLGSKSMARQVVEDGNLLADPGFTSLTAARPAGLTDRQWSARRRDAMAATLADQIKITTSPGDYIIGIAYRSTDPRLAAKVANAYAASFLTDDIRRSAEQNSYAEKYLLEQIATVQDKLRAAETRALAYARSNRIVGEIAGPAPENLAGGSATPQTVSGANLAAVNSTYAQARTARIGAEQRWRAAQSTSPAQLPEVQSNQVYQGLQSERAQAMAQLANLSSRYGANHPQVQELQSQIATINRQIGQVSAQVKNALRQNYLVAVRQEQGLSGELARVSRETLDEQARRVELNQLNSDAQAVRGQLQSLLERYNQIASAANVKPSAITMLDRAEVPDAPVSPNLFKNLLFGLVLGGGLAVGLAVLRETLDDKLRSADDVERKLGVPLLGMTPLVDSDETGADAGPLVESYASIRTALDFALPVHAHAAILFTSSQSVEGKTTTAVMLAKSYASIGKRVLLIDADLRRPSVSKAFDSDRGTFGLTEVLAGETDLAGALMPSGQANLDVLPVGPIPANPVEILSSPRLEQFLADMRQDYDLVLIDSAPVMGLADAPLLSRLVDGIVFVVEANRAHYGQAKTALRRLRDDGTLLGVVLTKFRALEAGQPYAYSYDYYAYGDRKAG